MKDDTRIKRLVAIKRTDEGFVAVFNVYDADGNVVDVIEVKLEDLRIVNHDCINYSRLMVDNREHFYVNGEDLGDFWDFKDYADWYCNPMLVIEDWPLPGGGGGPNGEHELLPEIDDDFEDR